MRQSCSRISEAPGLRLVDLLFVYLKCALAGRSQATEADDGSGLPCASLPATISVGLLLARLTSLFTTARSGGDVLMIGFHRRPDRTSGDVVYGLGELRETTVKTVTYRDTVQYGEEVATWPSKRHTPICAPNLPRFWTGLSSNRKS